jgi:hypothetical protein
MEKYKSLLGDEQELRHNYSSVLSIPVETAPKSPEVRWWAKNNINVLCNMTTWVTFPIANANLKVNTLSKEDT